MNIDKDKLIEEVSIKDAPEKVWLNIGDTDINEVKENGWKWNDLAEITWSSVKIDQCDIPYIRADLVSAHAITSMQGDSEPTAYLSRSKMSDRAISMLPTKIARDSEQAKGWSEWKPASIKDFEQHQQSIGKSDWMHDKEFIPLFTHDRVKGVSDSTLDRRVVVDFPNPCDCENYHLECHTAAGCKWIKERIQLSTPSDNDAIDAAKYRAINTPEIQDFIKAIELEALHQRDRWGAEGDAGKTDADWFWLIGYLAGKALHKPEKDLHHIITTAAACLNWHAAKTGNWANMRPGIDAGST